MKFYTAVVYSCQTFEGDTLTDVNGGVDEIVPTIEDGIEIIEGKIKRFRAYGKIEECGFTHLHLDSKLSTECDNITECYYTYRVNYGYGCYSIFKVKLQPIYSEHIHI